MVSFFKRFCAQESQTGKKETGPCKECAKRNENWKYNETKDEWRIEFKDVKQAVLDELEKRELHINEPVNIVDGFINLPYQLAITNHFILGGPTIPLVMLVGNSGRMYYFALKSILKDLEQYRQTQKE